MDLASIDMTQISYGVLFVWLLFGTMKKNDEREKRLQDTLEQIVPTLAKMNDKLDVIERSITNRKEEHKNDHESE